MDWYVAASLKKLGEELNTRWPDRDKTYDGTIGDANHSSRSSDHNPDPEGCVRARDITTEGIDKALVLAELIGDKRVKYVIHNGMIWSRTYAFKGRAYSGANPHEDHIHVSINADDASADDTSNWFTSVIPVEDKPNINKIGSRALRVGMRGADVAFVQRFISAKLVPDGSFGPKTEAAVKNYQRIRGIAQDGVVGRQTFGQMGVKATF